MKKIRFISGIALSLILTSCVENVSEGTSVILTGYVDEELASDTKTTLDTDFSIKWSENDHISVFASDGSGVSFTDVSVDGSGKTATFKGSIELADAYHAVYPKQEDATYASEGELFTVTLPTSQTPVAGSFGDGMNLAVAKSSDGNLHFKNVGALLAVQCPTNYASSIKIVSRDSEVAMSGKATVAWNNGEPVLSSTDKAVNYVEMTAMPGSQLGKIFYFVVYPGEYKGFDIIITNLDGTRTSLVSSSKPLTLKRNDNVLLYDGSFVGWNDKETSMYPFESGRSVPTFSDLTLCYGGDMSRVPSLWDKNRWKTHVIYTDKTGQDKWFFDSFLALEFAADGYVYNIANTTTPSAGKAQWETLLDYWFDETYGFQALDDCIEEALASAGQYSHKRYVIFSLPDPIYCQYFADKESSTTYWGNINGVVLDFKNTSDRINAYKWMIDQVRTRFNEKNYRHIELAGFYILSESLSERYNSKYKEFKTVIPAVADYCESINEGLYWIPYGYSADDTYHNDAIKNWTDYKFTSTILQPNAYWDTRRDWETICQEYINNCNLGMELEFEGSHGEGGWSKPEDLERTSSSILETVRTSYDAEGTAKGSPNPQAEENRRRFREYMQKCKDYDIYGNRMLVLYSGTNALYELATSTDEKDKELYHELGEFIINSPLKKK